MAGEVLAEQPEISVLHLDLDAPAALGWDTLRSAHGYQVAYRTVTSQVERGDQWLAGAALIARRR